MKRVLSKLLFLLILAILFIYYLCIRYVDEMLYQGIVLLIISLIGMITISPKEYWKEFWGTRYFVLVMLGVYVLFGVFHNKVTVPIEAQNDLLQYWLFFGIDRIVLFINSVMFFMLLIHTVSMRDILMLPLPINSLKWILLGRSLFQSAMLSIEQIEYFYMQFPEYQTKRQTIKERFITKIHVMLGFIMYMLQESEIQGELIDNRIKHCYCPKEVLK